MMVLDAVQGCLVSSIVVDQSYLFSTDSRYQIMAKILRQRKGLDEQLDLEWKICRYYSMYGLK